MTPAECLNLVTALRLHFTSPVYDYHRYGGKLRSNPDFTKRPDKNLIQRVARHPDTFNLALSNICINPNSWFADFLSEEGQERYEEWKYKKKNITAIFRKDLQELDDDLVTNFRVIEGQHPKALRRYLGGFISLETLSIMNALTNYWQHWNNNLKNDLIWKGMYLTIPKYQGFVKFNKFEIKKALKEKQSVPSGNDSK